MSELSAQAGSEGYGACDDVAGMAGLEPADEGVKVPCLTTWLHPCINGERLGPEQKLRPCRLNVGWVKGLEPSTPGTTIRCSNQLSYTHHITDVRAALGAGWHAWRDSNPRPAA